MSEPVTEVQTMPGIQPTIGYVVVKEWLLPVTLLLGGVAIGYALKTVRS